MAKSTKEKEVTENILVFDKIEINSFMGINKSCAVVLDFSKAKNNQNVAEFYGNEETHKTSAITGIAYGLGARLGMDKKKLINRQDGVIEINEYVTWKGYKHHIQTDESRVTIKRLSDDGKWKKVDDGSPTEMLKEMFGPVGLSPFSVREKDGKGQIKFFQEMFGSGEDASKKMKKLEEDIDLIFGQRRDVNRDAKNIKASLELEPLFQNYEQSQKLFKVAPSEEKEKKAVAEIKAQHDQYQNAVNEEKRLAGEEEKLKADIADLEAKLAAAKHALTAATNRRKTANTWLGTNSDIPKKYEAAQQAYINIGKEVAEYHKWREILRREKELIEMEEASVAATGKIDELRTQLLKLTKSCLPKVEGLTIKVTAGLDKTANTDGVYYNDTPIHELSESQYITMWCLILEAAGVKQLFIENITSLGSHAAETLNELSKNGVIVFTTRQDRKVDVIGVTFKKEVS